jgi:hypothetical protein
MSLLESGHCQKVQFFKHACSQYSPFTISIVWGSHCAQARNGRKNNKTRPHVV